MVNTPKAAVGDLVEITWDRSKHYGKQGRVVDIRRSRRSGLFHQRGRLFKRGTYLSYGVSIPGIGLRRFGGGAIKVIP